MTDREILEKILNELTGVKDEMKSLKDETGSVRNEVNLVKDEVSSVRNEVSSVKDEVSSVRNEVNLIKSGQQEDHLILKALMHNSEVNKAEHDKMFNKMAYMEGHLKNIDENLDAVKEIIGRHEVDIRVLKNRPV
ncbi:MAG: hypothetical protein GX987_04505 [Tissierellia bacterium]|nr:hypothetical protein [Tissierellia bacterium]